MTFAGDRQREAANLGRKAMIVRFASALRKQARRAILVETTQEAKHLTPVQIGQHAVFAHAYWVNVGSEAEVEGLCRDNLTAAATLALIWKVEMDDDGC